MGQLVGAAKEGLLALSVGVGLGVLTELMQEEVDDVVGSKGKVEPGSHDCAAWSRGWGGHARWPSGRRSAAAGADRGRRVLAGVSTRRYPRTQEPVGERVEIKARSTSKSAVSRTFVERTREALGDLMSRQLSDLRLAVMMLDGLELKGRMMIAEGIRALRYIPRFAAVNSLPARRRAGAGARSTPDGARRR